MSMEEKYPTSTPEIWGGIESSINRVGDQYRDQLNYSGHYGRPHDIDLFAAMGIRALRYPVLWEHHQPAKNSKIDWRWITGQLNNIRSHNIVPIVGLIHHGSGPSYTDLLDEEFPVKFASYAGKVARQFPWLEYYTPVNEPLTTARFSGLYGLWYPHQRNEASFIKMLLLQLKATVLAMREIRKVNPYAKLVQTEDLSKTHSTPLLSYQADFENERRWLTYDLLCGKVNDRHFFWHYFLSLGVPETELLFFVENNCAPDIMGFNYYVTSERYLDENLAAYPIETHGGNSKHRFADTEAVRTGHMEGVAALLTEAWQRYGLPMAITECHLCCTREEQLRWFHETWVACCSLKKDGMDIRGVTAWSLLGAYDWDSLLVQHNLSYETGVFDAVTDQLRPTLLTKMIWSLSTHGRFQHPLLEQRGWWNRNRMATRSNTIEEHAILILGKNSVVADAFAKSCAGRSIHYHMTDYDGLELISFIETYKPWAVIYIFDSTDVENSYAASLRISEICRSRHIQAMVLTGVGSQCKSNMLLTVNPYALVVQLTHVGNASIALPDQHTIGMIIDIFIDEEKGCWYISAEGQLTKRNATAPFHERKERSLRMLPVPA
jgi:dTDP-4-dehydrorhamnose reductase